MQRQRRCCSPPLVSAIWTRGIPEGTGPPGRTRKTQRISPLTPLLLTRLVENSPLPLSRLLPPRRTRTTNKEVLSAEGADKARVMAMTLLQRVSTPPPSRRRRKISLKSSATTVTRRDIMRPSVPRSQKTSVGPGDLYADDWA